MSCRPPAARRRLRAAGPWIGHLSQQSGCKSQLSSHDDAIAGGGTRDSLIARGPDDLLFTAPGGRTPCATTITGDGCGIQPLERLGLPLVGLHVLRHSAAARLIGAGASHKALQQVLRHRSAAFSLTVYGHIFETDLDELAERMEKPSAAHRRPTGVHFLAVTDEKSL